MTEKKFRKLLRAHFTAYYLNHKDTLAAGWISEAYRAAQNATAGNRQAAYEAIVAALPVVPAKHN